MTKNYSGKSIEVKKVGNKFYFSINQVSAPSGFFSESRALKYAMGIINRNENLATLIAGGAAQ
jgi:hypothetical protein